MMTASLVVTALIGLAVLFFGRQLFWLFVGAVGFLIGFTLATEYLAVQPEWVGLLIGLAAGLLGALVAVPLQRLAVAVAGFLAAGYAVYSLLVVWGVENSTVLLIVALLGALLGAVLVALLFDWALIVLSAGVGAALLTQAVLLGWLNLERPLPVVGFVVLLAVGIVAQAAQVGGPPPVRRQRVVVREE